MKGFLSTSKNRMNVCATMASKHQFKMSVNMNDANFCQQGLDKDSFRPCHVEVSCQDVCEGQEACKTFQQVRFNGTIYCSGDVLLVKPSDDDHPTFMKIHFMLAEENDGYLAFACFCCNVIEKNDRVEAFMVEIGSMLKIVKPSQLCSHRPLGLYKVRNKHFIVEKVFSSCRPV